MELHHISQPSLSDEALNLDTFYMQDLFLLWKLFRFFSFSVAMDMNVNKMHVAPRIHDISRAMEHVIRFPRPSPSVFA